MIVPALDEAGRIGACIRSARDAGADEVIVADGGSADATIARSRKAGADAVVSTRPGRALQMNAGAAAATGDILCFLHADARLPAGGCDSMRRAVRDRRAAGGAFSIDLEASPDASRWTRALAGLTAAMIGVRSRLFRRYTGDQAMFVPRSLFEALGGFEAVPLMEDVRFSAALRAAGPTVLLRERVVASARRWEAGGPLRTIFLMWFLRAAHAAGMHPARCARIYGKGPPPR